MAKEKKHASSCASYIGDSCDCDGYHTFEELYDHRIALFIALCKFACQQTEFNHYIPQYEVWRSRHHSDGKRWAGWFIMGINKEDGEQITYHLPEIRWEECDFAETLDKSPEFDGHKPEDVIGRLGQIACG